MYTRLFVCYAVATMCLTLDTVIQASIEPGSIVALLAAFAAGVALILFQDRQEGEACPAEKPRWKPECSRVARMVLCSIPLGCVTLGASTELAHLVFLWLDALSLRAEQSVATEGVGGI